MGNERSMTRERPSFREWIVDESKKLEGIRYGRFWRK